MNLIYLSPVPWGSFEQRPHKFVRWFQQKYGGKVLWVDPYPTRLINLSDFRYPFELLRQTGVNLIAGLEPSWLTVVGPKALPIEPFEFGGAVNRLIWNRQFRAIAEFAQDGNAKLVIGKPSELALQVLNIKHINGTIYDAMDDFPAFYEGISKRSMFLKEEQIASRVSSIWVSSDALHDKFNNFKSKTYRVLNACAMETMPISINRLRPSQQVILGYVGTIGRWFDWDLVFAIANAVPSMIIRLIGPVHVALPKEMPANVEFIASCSHELAIAHMQQFDVGLIPFKINKLTMSVDPIKYYEYHALGLPVLSSKFGQMSSLGVKDGVLLICRNTNFVSVIEAALAMDMSMSEINDFRVNNSWVSRFNAVTTCID